MPRILDEYYLFAGDTRLPRQAPGLAGGKSPSPNWQRLLPRLWHKWDAASWEYKVDYLWMQVVSPPPKR
jgi:hypothetical protein